MFSLVREMKVSRNNIGPTDFHSTPYKMFSFVIYRRKKVILNIGKVVEYNHFCSFCFELHVSGVTFGRYFTGHHDLYHLYLYIYTIYVCVFQICSNSSCRFK